MIKIKSILTTYYFLFISTILFAQISDTLNIDECYTQAMQHYPLVKQKELIKKSSDYSIKNASKGYLPKLNIGGNATYQSDVTQVPINIPNMTIPVPDKDQYKIFGEITQPITDAFVIKQQKQWIENNMDIEKQKTEIDIYQIKERINQLYFGILLINEQLVQIQIIKKDIQSGIDKINAAIINGIALKTNADALKAEMLKSEQNQVELEFNRKAYLNMLGLFINQQIDENTLLEQPQALTLSSTINRPELLLFEKKQESIEINNKLLVAKNLPRLSLFFQSGYGRPTLNMLSNNFDYYYLGGIRLNWTLSGLYTYSNEKKILNVNSSLLDVQKETFLFNTNLLLEQKNQELIKIKQLIEKDNEIIALRTNIKNTTLSQLENGIITSNDYIRDINAENQAKQNLILHQIQMLMTTYNYQISLGN